MFWPGEFHRLYSPPGLKESDTTERLSLTSLSHMNKTTSSQSDSVMFTRDTCSLLALPRWVWVLMFVITSWHFCFRTSSWLFRQGFTATDLHRLLALLLQIFPLNVDQALALLFWETRLCGFHYNSKIFHQIVWKDGTIITWYGKKRRFEEVVVKIRSLVSNLKFKIPACMLSCFSHV